MRSSTSIIVLLSVVLLSISCISAAYLPTEIMTVNRIVDKFESNEDSVLVIQLYSPLTLNEAPIQANQSTTIHDETILGIERDLSLVVVEGIDGSVMSCGVSIGEFSLATASNSHGYAVLQYDGEDESSEINPTGLGGISLKEGGSNAFQLNTVADHSTDFSIRVYSGANAVSEYKGIIPQNQRKPHALYAKFSEFEGNADFNNVGAIEVIIYAYVNVDAIITGFNVGKVKTLFAATVGDDSDFYDFDAQCALSSEEYEELFPDYYPECEDEITTSSSNNFSDFISDSYSRLLSLLSYAFSSLNFGVTSDGRLDISADGGNTLMDVIDVSRSELEDLLSTYFTSNNFIITSDGNMIVYPEPDDYDENSAGSLVPSVVISTAVVVYTFVL